MIVFSDQSKMEKEKEGHECQSIKMSPHNGKQFGLLFVGMHKCIHTYIYIYTHRERERDREIEREISR